MLFLPREKGQEFSHLLGEIGQGLVEYGSIILIILAVIAAAVGLTLDQLIALLGLPPLPW